MEQQSLEQQAKAWLERREEVIRSRRVSEAQGWWVSDRAGVVNPDSLEEPLRSEVLRQLGLAERAAGPDGKADE